MLYVWSFEQGPTTRLQSMQNFAVTAVKKDGSLDMALKSTYSAPKYTIVSTISQAGKVRQAGVPRFNQGFDSRTACI